MPPRATLLGLALILFPQAARSVPPADKALFDGKSLAGWKATDFFGKGKVHVRAGAIVMENGKRMTGVTYARGDFPRTDYEVTLEARRLEGSDFFATTTFPVGADYCSLVVGGWGGKVVGLSSIDSEDASRNLTRKDREFERGRWYRLRIRVTADRIQAWVDADRVVDLDTTDRGLSIRVECLPSRPFGIATWQTTGEVRDIRVRREVGGRGSPPHTPPVSPAEKKGKE